MITFHKTLAGCEEGQPEAWGTFLTDYTPTLLQLTDIYMPGYPSRIELWCTVLSALCMENFKLLRGFDHQSEREFLMDLRRLLLEKGVSALDPPPAAPEFSEPTAESVGTLLRGLPLLHQELLFLKLAGYSDATLEKIFRIKPSIAQKSLEHLGEAYRLHPEHEGCLHPAAWLRLLRGVQSAKSEKCPPLRQLVRIQDGQAGWYDKDPVEKHMTECLHCLEAWTALREISYWRYNAPPLAPEKASELLSRLPIQKKIPQPFLRSLRRLWG